jgi:hypothetical protein
VITNEFARLLRAADPKRGLTATFVKDSMKSVYEKYPLGSYPGYDSYSSCRGRSR